MQLPARTGRSWLTRPRTVGTPAHWAKQGALFGGLVGWLTPVSLAAVSAVALGEGLWGVGAILVNPALALGGLLGAAIGAVLGLVQPALLDSVRGRVPLPVVAAGQGLVGAFAGAATGAAMAMGAQWLVAGAIIDWAVVAFVANAAGLVGGVGALVAWLPITVATVLGTRTTPVTASAAIGVPASLVLVLLFLLA